jgi:hypothetical protein
MAERKDPSRVKLKNVRLSFAHLFRPQAFGDGEGEPKYNCNFLINPKSKDGKANLEAVEDAIEYVKKEKWPKSPPKLNESKICLRDGNNTEYDGYEDMMYVSASNAKRPMVLDRDKTALTEEDGVIYSGCYVDAIIRVWAQDNKYGKRINASLEAVRFRKDGEAFGAAPPDPDEFDDLDDEDEEDEDEDEKPRRRRSRDDDEDEDDRPRRRRSRDDDEDEDDRPSRRKRRDDDEEDEDDRPRRRSRDDDEDDEDRPSKNSRARRRRDEDDDI